MRKRRTWKERVISFSITFCIGFLLVGVAMFIFQRKLIYHPRPYLREDFATLRSMNPPGREIEFSTSCGRQTAFYVPLFGESFSARPRRLWVMFCGNAMRALDWLYFVEDVQAAAAQTSSTRLRDCAFLLVDYPGYGSCAGSPSRSGIAESGAGAIAALAKEFTTGSAGLETDLNVLGLSIGTAAALEFATKHPVKRVVLLAPFDTLREVAGRVVGPLSYLLRDRFDNSARLHELIARNPPPDLFMFHGDADSIVPVAIARRLARNFPEVKYHEIPQADHNNVLDAAEHGIIKILGES